MIITVLISYIIGPAGSGKTTLTNALISYIQNYNQEVTPVSINLDPAVQDLPYLPDIDIQDYVTVENVVEETGLGPNGAVIEAADRMINYLEDIKFEIDQYNNPEYIIVDTPGQMELFSFRNTGPLIANALGFGNVKTNIIFCYDSKMCTSPNGFISTLLLAASVQYRFPNIPLLNVLTKKDLLSVEKLDTILDWVGNDFSLQDSIQMEEKGMMREFTVALERAFRDFGAISNLLPISAKYDQDVDQVFAALQRIFDEYESPYM